MKELCCVLSPAWKCDYCDWKMCYSCWNHPADDRHRDMSPDCLLSAAKNEDIGCITNNDMPYTLTKRDL